ncbi:MAG TPA: MBL fold metallo-hydrolase [Thermoplasmata archaeon]|nr:MBL fold metallo-hydrolase [Thermoplasmata archaeon]
MRLHFLGTGSGSFRGTRRGPTSALLDTLLLDCGAGATGKLEDLGRFDAVEGVLISHLHTDHIAGLLDFLLHTIISGRTRPLTIVSPPGLGAILEAVFAAESTVKRPETVYPFRLIEGGSIEATIGRWTLRSVALDHTVPDLGYLLASDGITAFYAGDTREPSAARSTRADYVIHEATYPDRLASVAREYGHSTSSEAAETARAMGARKLWLNHVAGERPDDERAIAEEARRVFTDSVVAEDLAAYDL